MTEDSDAVHPIVRSSIPVRQFHDFGEVATVAVFPDRRRMATNSSDGMVRLWDLKTGVILMELEGRGDAMLHMALSRDGKLIASSDREGYIIAWHTDTGRPLARAFKPSNSNNGGQDCPLDFSLDGTMLAAASGSTTSFWSTKTWQLEGKSLQCDRPASSVQYSPSGELLAIATHYDDITIWNPVTKQRIASIENIENIARGQSLSFGWTPDGTRLLSGGRYSVTIREWDLSTRQQAGDIWRGPTDHPWRFAINCNGTVVASPTINNCVRLWRLSDRRTIAIFQHSDNPCCVTFSMDGRHILVGGKDKKILEWAVPEHAWPQGNDQATYQAQDFDANVQVSDIVAQDSHAGDFESKILVMNTTVRNECINGDFTTAEDLLTQEIDANGNNYRAFANRSVVMARKLVWDRALDDATKSLSIQPSLMGYISKGIALCGNKRVRDARNAFDIAFTFIDGDSKTTHLLFLIKSVALFNANQHAEAMERLQELATTCPNVDTVVASRTVEVYLHIQLGNNALDCANPSDAADHFADAVNASTLSKSAIHSKYEELVVLFGCDFTSLWQTANKKRCHALLRAGKLAEVFEAYRDMVDMTDESMKASCLDWTIGLMQEMSTFRGNAPDADAAPETMMRKHEDDNDEKDSISISDIDSDIDHVEDVVC